MQMVFECGKYKGEETLTWHYQSIGAGCQGNIINSEFQVLALVVSLPQQTLLSRLILSLYHQLPLRLVNSSKNQRPLSNELPVQRQNLDLPLYESNVLQKSQRNLFKIRCTCFNTVGTVKETYQGNCRQSRRCELREEQNEQQQGHSSVMEEIILTMINGPHCKQ